MKKDIDITENIAAGDVDHIISILNRFREIGYDRLYWDGYNSAIYLYKNNQTERSKREDFKNYDDYNLICGCHSEPGMFSRHHKCNLDHESDIP